MLRTVLIALSRSQALKAWLTHSALGKRVSRRFVAGETLEEALAVVQERQAAGMMSTVAYLGEWVNTEEQARAAAASIRELIQALGRAGARANVSVKLSHLGVHLNADLARDLLRDLAEAAREFGMLIRIDMEESELVDITFRLHRELWTQGYRNLGLVLQAYLRRTEGDLRRLLPMRVPIRLVKGAYKEPRDIAFPKKRDVDANFDRLARLLLEAAQDDHAPRLSPDGRFPPLVAIASHDPNRIYYAQNMARRLGLPRDAVEYQFLYGIRRDLQESFVQQGYPVRIYVPYGEEWYPYFMRRLAERPANLFFLLRHGLRR